MKTTAGDPKPQKAESRKMKIMQTDIGLEHWDRLIYSWKGKQDGGEQMMCQMPFRPLPEELRCGG